MLRFNSFAARKRAIRKFALTRRFCFQRSDNYTLARQGIIAHTVSSFGLHTDYHRPSDEIETIDFNYMTRAINSMVEPVRWLVNSNFKPVWYEGKKP